jgi:hypothetical protein
MKKSNNGRKVMLWVVILTAVAFAAFELVTCKSDSKPVVAEVKQEALTVSKNTPAFNESFEKVLSAYFSLKTALTEYDTVAANTAAGRLSVAADSLDTEQIQGDTTGAIQEMAKNYAGTITGSATALIGETDIIKKKTEFKMISDALYDLVRTVKYDRQKLYHQHCPMAFNDTEEAWWISTSNKIENPYLGKKHPKYKGAMLECGDITDSLDFRK